MQCPKAALFDLDDTLAESFKAPSPEMLEKLQELLNKIPVAIMTGASFQRVEREVLSGMPGPFANFYIFPNSTAQCFVHDRSGWQERYSHALTVEDRARIVRAIEETVSEIEGLKEMPYYGRQLFDRESQVAYTFVGFDAPTDYKQSWDVDGSKRKHICEVLEKKIPGFDILVGGACRGSL